MPSSCFAEVNALARQGKDIISSASASPISGTGARAGGRDPGDQGRQARLYALGRNR